MATTSSQTLHHALLAERNAAFFRLRGGYPVPLAGALWWAALGLLGYRVKPHLWIFIAFASSGLIFPLAVLLARIARIDFLRDRTAISDATLPAIVSMTLFWPIAFAAYSNFPQLVPLVLALGMSVMWPVIGWTYGRTAIFITHAVTRAVLCFVLWTWFPATRFTLLPLSVAALYVATIAVTLYASRPAANVTPQTPSIA